MSVASVFAIGCFLLGTLLFLVRQRWGGRVLTLLGGAFGILLIVGSEVDGVNECVVVLDQPLGTDPQRIAEVRALLEQLRAKGTQRVALIAVTHAAAGELRWDDLTATSDPLDEWSRSPCTAEDFQDAFKMGFALLEQRSFRDSLHAWWQGRTSKIVVAVGDLDAWKQHLPVQNNELVAKARTQETTVDVIELKPSPYATYVTVEASIPLPAERPLSSINTRLTVRVKAPFLLKHQGANATIAVTGNLNIDEATLPTENVTVPISSTGEVAVSIPFKKFQAPGADVSFSIGHVRAELQLTLTVNGQTHDAEGVGYIPVQRADYWFVHGQGSGVDRLAVPPLVAPSRKPEDYFTKLVMLAAQADRAGELSNAEVLTATTFQQRMTEKKPMPRQLFLHEMPAAFWTVANCERLLEATQQGMHLFVFDPPPLPDDANLAKLLQALLPAHAARDRRYTNPVAQTVATLPILNFVFDEGRWGRIPTTPGKTNEQVALEDAMKVQLAVANKLLDIYRSKGLLKGELHQPSGMIEYKPHADDLIVVRVAPRIKADDFDTNDIFASNIQLRLAALFADMQGFGELEGAGLKDAPGVRPYPEADPLYTPNQAVVLFTGRMPQPEMTAWETTRTQVPIPYKLGNETASRTYKASADGALAHVLARGITCVAIQIETEKVGTANDYKSSWLERVDNWRKDRLPNPVDRFRREPEGVLDAQTTEELKALLDGAPSGYLLTSSQANARLIRSAPAKPLFRTFNLLEANPLGRCQPLAEEISNVLLPLHEKPAHRMAIAVVNHDRVIDERVGPARRLQELRAKQSDPTEFAKLWPAEQPWAAPQRWRRLQVCPPMQQQGRANTLAYAVEVGANPLAPQPLIVGGIVGNAHVVCFGYSPFELGPANRDLHNVIFKPEEPTRPDFFGPQRILDPALLLARLRPLPTAGPQLREIHVLDRRGGLELVVDFLPKQVADEPRSFWTPKLTPMPTRPASDAPLQLVGIAWERGEARFRLEPEDAKRLFEQGKIKQPVQLAVGEADGPVFVVKAPPDGRSLALSAYQSVLLFGQLTGGATGPISSIPQRPRSLRTGWLVAFCGVLLLLMGQRAFARWGHLMRRSRSYHRDQPLALRPMDIPALLELWGFTSAPPRSDMRAGLIDRVRRLMLGDKVTSITKKSIIRMAYDIETPIEIEDRVPLKGIRVDIVVSLSESMRVGGTRLPKIHLAGVISQLIGELAWLYGAEVRLLGVGLAMGYCKSETKTARERDNELLEQCLAWAKEHPAGPIVEPSSLEADSGTCTIWISDFFTEHLSKLLTYGSQAREEDGKFGGVCVQTPEDAEQIGVGYMRSPFTPLDRSFLTTNELRAAITTHIASVQQEFTRRYLSFARVQSTMTGDELMAELDQAELLGLITQ